MSHAYSTAITVLQLTGLASHLESWELLWGVYLLSWLPDLASWECSAWHPAPRFHLARPRGEMLHLPLQKYICHNCSGPFVRLNPSATKIERGLH